MTFPLVRSVQTLLVLGAGLLMACSPDPAGARSRPTSASTTRRSTSSAVTSGARDTISPRSWRDTLAPELDSLAPAYQQFAKFLDSTVATRTPSPEIASVYTIGTDLGLDQRDLDSRWLATSRIVSVRSVGDSAHAVAVITTVARQVPETEEGHYAVRFGIRDDTAHWLLVRNAETGGNWKVDGDGWIGGDPPDQFTVLRLGHYIHWVVGSREQAIAAVDSIRRARGLEVVR